MAVSQNRALRAVACFVTTSFALAGLGRAPLARASGLENPHVADALGQPALANPYAAYFNPGALAGVRGTQIVADGALVIGFTRYDRTGPLSPSPTNTPSDPNYAAYVASNTGTNSAVGVGGIPFLGVASDFGSKRFFGALALYAPFGGSVHWGTASRWAGNAAFPGAVDGPGRWQSISANDASVAATAAFGMHLVEGLSLGLGLSVYDHTIQLTRALDADGSDDVTAPDGTLKEGRAYFNVSGVDAGVSVGLYWQVDPGGRLRLGASYTSQPGFGTMRLHGALEQKFGVTPSGKTDVDILQAYPDIVRLGGAYRVSPGIDLRAYGEYARWSVLQNECVVDPGRPCDLNPDGSAKRLGQVIANIPSHFHDAFAAHAGVGYWPLPSTQLFFDFGVDSGAVPAASLGTTLFDSFKLMGTAGVRHRFGEHLWIATSYTGVYYLPVTVTGETEAKAPSDIPNANGAYASHLSFFDLNATIAF